MQLSKRTQYGIRALVCFADAYEQGHLGARELSKRERLPTKFMESILNSLTRGRFLDSRKGAFGGYRLARPPEQITLAEIIERLETTRLLDAQESSANERPGETAFRLIEDRLALAAREVFQKTTLAQLAADIALAGGGQMYYI